MSVIDKLNNLQTTVDTIQRKLDNHIYGEGSKCCDYCKNNLLFMLFHNHGSWCSLNGKPWSLENQENCNVSLTTPHCSCLCHNDNAKIVKKKLVEFETTVNNEQNPELMCLGYKKE